MAIGAITMILANVGLQIYNNWCGSRQNAALQQKREEFERAAKERNTEHMWRLMREGQELTLQLEKEKHADRLNELKDEVDHLLEKLTYETTISNWPLKVLPIVMKNQAFGNLLANQEENVAMHVIFTRSNYDKFNKLVYPVVEKQLEQYCDKHWSTATVHPVLFYSGAWKPMSSPTDVQVSAMREELKNLPTLLIAPFFRPDDGKLVFQVHMWGVGPNSFDLFNIAEIEPKNDEFHFQRTYTNKQDYENEMGLLDEIVEDLVPYLQCMIGYMADTYFWSSAGLAPHLPLLVTNGTINTDGMKYLIDDSREYYDKLLLESEENAKEKPFMQQNLLNLYEGSAELWEEKEQSKLLNEIFLNYCERVYCKRYASVKKAIEECPLSINDTAFISAYLSVSKDKDIAKSICSKVPFRNLFTLSKGGALLKSNTSFVDIQVFNKEDFVRLKEDNYDILNTIEEFKNFVSLNGNRIPIKDPSLYIEVVGYSVFIYHICDPDSMKIIRLNSGMDYIIECKKLKHERQIKSLFKHSEHASIICRFSRIDKLISTINDDNTLIF